MLLDDVEHVFITYPECSLYVRRFEGGINIRRNAIVLYSLLALAAWRAQDPSLIPSRIGEWINGLYMVFVLCLGDSGVLEGFRS